MLFILLALPGCWDVQDMKDRAFVTAIGIDATQEIDSPKYKITFEFIRPAGLKRGAGTPASFLQTVEANSIHMAIEEMQSRVARRIDLSHLMVILIGEEKAKKDFRDIADYFSRHPEVQKRIKVMFVQGGEALDALKSEPLFEPYLSAELVAKAQIHLVFSIIRTNPFIELLLDLRSTGGKALASRILVPSGEDFNIREGAAVFNQWKLVGWLDTDETQGANWIIDDIRGTVEGKNGDSIYTYFVNKQSVRIIPDTSNGEISFTVNLRTDGAILQQQGERVDLTDPKIISEIEDLLSQTIQKQVQEAITKAQKDFGVDYLGFGMALNRRKPKLYGEVDWDAVFPSIPINVEVESVITRIGLAP